MTAPFPTSPTAIVTGAASQRGIGRATATRLASHGWNVGLLDLDGAACAALAADLHERYGVAAHGVGVDVVDQPGVQEAVAELAAALPPITALANIAGVSSPTPYFQVGADEWRRVVGIDLDGVHHVTQAVAAILVENRVGRIVSLSSVSAQRGGGTFSKTTYSVAKAGVIGLMRSLARELGEYGVTANAISPGPIDTDIMGGALTDQRKVELAAEGLIKRVGTADDIAAAIEFLIGPDAGWITGQTLNVDGGLYMH